MNREGEILVHRHRPAGPEPFLKAVAPYRAAVVGGVEGLFTWSWLADLCAREGLPFVLGQARDMQAIHGGKVTHDPIDSHKIAARRRGGLLPQASVYPAAMRATRDLLRRRRPLAHNRAALLAPVHHPHRQDQLPAIGHQIAYQANRDGVAERCAEPAGHKRLDVARARIPSDDARRRDGDRTRVNTATHPDATTLYRLQTVPGIGTILSRVWRDAIQAIDRFPRVQDVVSSGRLVTGAQASAGTRLGTAGPKLGTAHRTWAFSAAAVVCLRDPPPAQTDLARLEKHHDQGHALTVLAQQLARAVYDRRTRHGVCDSAQFFPRSWRGAAAPRASLDKPGMTLPDALDTAACTASLHAQARLGRETLRPAR